MEEPQADEGVEETERERIDTLEEREDDEPRDYRIDPPDDAPPPVGI